jgi:hypothetical protein
MRTIVALIATLAIDAMACHVPPPEQRVPPKELIGRTKNIALAQVVKAEVLRGTEVRYTFNRIKSISGSPAETFTIVGRALVDGELTTFGNHTERLFWSSVGRSTNDTDCQIYPTFVVGGTYLVFLDRPYHVKSFEQIVRTHGDKQSKDKWLQYVEDNVGK